MGLTAVKPAGQNSARAGATARIASAAAWPTERWVAIIVLVALALLIGIRAGFRGVNVLGVRASVS